MIVPTEEEIRNKAHYLYDEAHGIWWIHDPEPDEELKRGDFWERARAQLEADPPEAWITRLERNIKAVDELIEKHGPVERLYRFGTRRFYGDDAWEEFVRSYLWAGRVEPKPDKVEEINWLEQRRRLQERLEEVKKMSEAPPKAIPPEELPEDIRGYVGLLHVNVTAKPEKRLLPGFKEPTWVIPVHDEETCDTVSIVHGYPYTELEKYRLMKITNKRGVVITVLVLREEYKRLAVPSPPEPEIEGAIQAAEEAVPEVMVTAPVDWRRIREIAKRVQGWLKAAERQLEKRNSVAVYTHVTSIIDWLDDVKEKLLARAEKLRIHEARRVEPVIKILRDEEYEELWKEFSRELSEEGIDPIMHKDRFDDLIAWNMPLEDNRAVVMDEARGIILERKMRKYIRRLPLKPVRFSWKWVGWGLSSLKVDAGVLKDAAKQENVVQAYSATTKMIETAEKLKKLLEMSPDVIGFRELKRGTSD